MSQLTIFKASAGSGKTFRLVVEYLKLIIKNPNNYRFILAVTFTNKATSEMKERIVRDLNKLATESDAGLIQLISEETDLPMLKVVENAKLSLAYILHDYDRFSVSTIDSFFQKVLRSFARESGLYGMYEVELDQDAVLDEACERLLMSVDTDTELRQWLTEMLENQLEEGKSWQIHDKIMELGKELQKESFQQFMALRLTLAEERERLKQLRSELIKRKKWFENSLQEHGKAGLELMALHNLTFQDFKGGSRSFTNYFNYWAACRTDKLEPTKTLLEAIDNDDNWALLKSAKRADILACVSGGLNQKLKDILRFLNENSADYLTACELSKYIYALGVLSTLAVKVRETGQERNTLMLGEADLLLKGIIGNNDAPFLYEKAGTFYRNFMIDEFQDTSVIQWENFRPLIVNSLAEHNRNLVVGDVKQSIYRWRNSNWQLLNKEIKKDLSIFGVDDVTLEANWRSAENVVKFNNFFFEKARTILQTDFNADLESSNIDKSLSEEYRVTIESVFADVVQKPKSKIADGLVQCHFIDDSEKGVYEQQTLERLIASIEEVQEKGFKAGEIAILVKKNKQGKMIAEAIINHKNTKGNSKYCYEVISDDSLYIQSSAAVRFLVGLLSYITSPFDHIVKAAVVYEYSTVLLPHILERGFQPRKIVKAGQQSLMFDCESDHSGQFLSDKIIAEYFPFFNDENKNAIPQTWINQPLIDLVNELEVRYMLHVLPGEQANIQSFKDVVADFSIREGGNIHKFLEWWGQFGNKVKLQSAGKQNAIRIMTIHKSKGLEFPIVMVPFCDWSLVPDAKRTNILWCETAGTPYDQFPVLPVNFSKNLRKTLFANQYFTELLLSYIDNINVLYVALTRAVNGLYVFTKIPVNDESKEMGNLIKRVVGSDGGKMFSNNDDRFVEFGQLNDQVNPENLVGSEINLSSKMNITENIGKALRLKRNYEGFFDEQKNPRELSINIGKQMHEILSLIDTKNDLPRALDRLTGEGKLEQEKRSEIERSIQQLFSNAQVADWFNGTYRVLNETTVISPNEGFLRPDRVMVAEGVAIVVDYKVTSEIESKHNFQVRGYMKKMQQMGFEKVEGWVWYLKSDQLVSVKN